ncbi:pyridoxamine 5'-phosphate oxidase family protein [Haloarchaeobius sp. DFWS5]|uniref:pyridoxamine 5'-phosphate oxidase family protein n=1 Tax=Haloarchaeobius sp. DFWS5 TaxID=3446114 RepID=UPI003EB6EE0F
MTVDELEQYGLEQMADTAMNDFLSSHRTGVLGLAADDAPYLLPMSYGYDGERNLYFTYLLGPESTKQSLTETATSARFLVYDAQSPFTWESVLLRGVVELVPAAEWGDIESVLDEAWRPDLLETARTSGDIDVLVYRFVVEERSGIRHTGLPEALR